MYLSKYQWVIVVKERYNCSNSVLLSVSLFASLNVVTQFRQAHLQLIDDPCRYEHAVELFQCQTTNGDANCVTFASLR